MYCWIYNVSLENGNGMHVFDAIKQLMHVGIKREQLFKLSIFNDTGIIVKQLGKEYDRLIAYAENATASQTSNQVK